MNIQRTIGLVSLLLLAIMIFRLPADDNGQSGVTVPPPVASHQTAHAAAQTTAGVSSGGGIHWTVPSAWTPQGERAMRLATYTIPASTAAGGSSGGGADKEGGECAVFFFGSGQGGDVKANIDRWVSQFEAGAKVSQASKTVNGIRVTTVTINGTYGSPGGPMMQSQGKKTNYVLLGAIVEAPQGAVFFKATGPAATMAASQKDFDALVNSIRKAAA